MLEFSSFPSSSKNLSSLISDAFLVKTLDLSSESFFILDGENSEILACNISAAQLFEAASRRELINTSFVNLYKLQPLNYSEGIAAEQIEKNGFFEQELAFHTLKKNAFWAKMIKRSVKTQSGERVIIKVTKQTNYIKSEEALSDILKITSKETGESFFKALTTSLCSVFGASCSFIGEVNNEDSSLLDMVYSHGIECVSCKSISIQSSCIENVMRGYASFYPVNIQELFPDDEFVRLIQAKSFLGSPIFDTGGKVIGVLGIISSGNMVEIPDSRKILSIFAHRSGAEIQRLKSSALLKMQTYELARANLVKDRLMRLMANDLQMPMKTIISFVDLIQKNYEQYSKTEILNKVEVVDQSLQNLYFLLENFSDWSKIEQEASEFLPERLNVFYLFDKVIQNLAYLAKIKSVQIRNEIDKNLFACSDAEMSQTIVRNLISNAIKFSQCGGEVYCSGLIKDEKIVVEVVEYNSINTKDEILHSIEVAEDQFYENYQENHHPTLGLYLCKAYLEKLGGSLWLEEREKNNIVFCFDLPIAK